MWFTEETLRAERLKLLSGPICRSVLMSFTKSMKPGQRVAVLLSVLILPWQCMSYIVARLSFFFFFLYFAGVPLPSINNFFLLVIAWKPEVTNLPILNMYQYMCGTVSWHVVVFPSVTKVNLLKAFLNSWTYYPAQKKKNHPWNLRWEEHCSILWWRAISAGQGHPRLSPRLLPCADRASSSMISDDEQRSSHRESRKCFFFFVQGSS